MHSTMLKNIRIIHFLYINSPNFFQYFIKCTFITIIILFIPKRNTCDTNYDQYNDGIDLSVKPVKMVFFLILKNEEMRFWFFSFNFNCLHTFFKFLSIVRKILQVFKKLLHKFCWKISHYMFIFYLFCNILLSFSP